MAVQIRGPCDGCGRMTSQHYDPCAADTHRELLCSGCVLVFRRDAAVKRARRVARLRRRLQAGALSVVTTGELSVAEGGAGAMSIFDGKALDTPKA